MGGIESFQSAIKFCFGQIAKTKFYDTLIFLLTQDHMALEISKHCSSYSFHPMSAMEWDDIPKLYEDTRYHGKVLAINFLGN